MNSEEIIEGESIQCLIRVKPNTCENKQNIKVEGKNLVILDHNKRVVEDLQWNNLYGSEFPLGQIFEEQVMQYLGPLVQGFNVSVMAMGQHQSGKTYVLQESRHEQGMAQLLSEGLFRLLDNKQRQSGGDYESRVRVRCVEVVEEEVSDMLQEGQVGNKGDLVEDEWEGVRIDHVRWITVQDHHQLDQCIYQASLKRQKFNSKAAGVTTVEVVQNLKMRQKQSLVLVSRLHLFDMPGDQVLLDKAEEAKMKEGDIANKGVFAVAGLLQQLARTQAIDHIYYSNSALTTLLKDTLAGNALTLVIFCLEQGDYQKNLNTLHYFKLMNKIYNYPIVNDSKALGLLKKMRREGLQAGPRVKVTGDINVVEMEKRMIQHNLDKLKAAEQKQQLAAKVSEYKEQYTQVLTQKNTFQNQLIESENEKLEVSKALIQLQIENTKLMEILQNEKFELNNKIINQEGDLLQQNMKEEMALKQIADLQQEVDGLSEERKDLEREIVALKKNYLRVRSEWEKEKGRNEDIGLELINVVNENKSQAEQLKLVYEQKGQSNQESEVQAARVQRLETANQDLKEALGAAKAQVEEAKVKLIQYELLDKQNQLDMEQKQMQMEREWLEKGKDNQQQLKQIQLEGVTQQGRLKDQQVQWESQKMELLQQLKRAQRKGEELAARVEQQVQEAQAAEQHSNQLALQVDEMRTVYKDKLVHFMQLSAQPDQQVNLSIKSKEELLRTYSLKESELQQALAAHKQQVKDLKAQVNALQDYARHLKALAEDWAPLGVELPDILKKGFHGVDTYQHYQNNNNNNNNNNNKNFALQDSQVEIQQMTNNHQLELAKKEKIQMQEENSRLVKMLKDNKKWDVYLLQKENSRLLQTLKMLEKKESMGPASGDTENMRQKLIYFDRIVRQLEQERSELIVRSTMAEEQLKSMTAIVQKKSSTTINPLTYFNHQL